MITKEYLAVLPNNWGCIKFKTWYKAETNLISTAMEGFGKKWARVLKSPVNLKRCGFDSQLAWEVAMRDTMVIIPLKQVNQAKTYLIDLDKGICNVLVTKKKTKRLKKNTHTV